MTYEEYKKAFEDILALSEKIEKLAKKNKFDDIEPLFDKRTELFSKLELPEEDLTEEQIMYIFELRDKIQEKTQTLMRIMFIQKSEIKKELINLTKENQVVETYKIPQGETKSSIFDIKE